MMMIYLKKCRTTINVENICSVTWDRWVEPRTNNVVWSASICFTNGKVKSISEASDVGHLYFTLHGEENEP